MSLLAGALRKRRTFGTVALGAPLRPSTLLFGSSASGAALIASHVTTDDAALIARTSN